MKPRFISIWAFPRKGCLTPLTFAKSSQAIIFPQSGRLVMETDDFPVRNHLRRASIIKFAIRFLQELSDDQHRATGVGNNTVRYAP